MENIEFDRIRDTFSRIAEAKEKLYQLRELPEPAFLSTYLHTESAKYLLLVCVGSLIDLCNSIVSRYGKRAPENYADCFGILGEMGVIEIDLANRLKPMARFRNFLVHQYWQVDNTRIYQIIQNELGVLDDFRNQVEHWLASHTNS